MAGNKFDTQFEKVKVTEAKLLYTGLYGTEVVVEGTPQQIIKHLLDKI